MYSSESGKIRERKKKQKIKSIQDRMCADLYTLYTHNVHCSMFVQYKISLKQQKHKNA